MPTSNCSALNKRSKRGITLVELMVVIAIVGILASLLFPVFVAARKDGQRVSCISNLRQIGGAVAMYVQDYDGKYPYAINPADRAHPDRWDDHPAFMAVIPELPQFHDVVYPYTRLRELFHCPSDWGISETEFVPGWGVAATPSCYFVFGTSYFYNSNLAALQASDLSITTPVNTLVLMDADGEWHGSDSLPADAYIARRYNVLLADGHVRNVTHGQLTQDYVLPE